MHSSISNALELGFMVAAIISLPYLLIGTFILKLLATKIGKVETAKYMNTLLVVIIGGIGTYIILYVAIDIILSIYLDVGARWGIGLGIASSMMAISISWAMSYIPAGKYIWKTGWMNSLKANIVWIGFCALAASICLAFWIDKLGKTVK